MANKILNKLLAGDLRRKGRSEEVVSDLCRHPQLLEDLLQGLCHPDPAVRMRTADALEKYSRDHAAALDPYKKCFINDFAAIGQKEVRWHMAQILPCLTLTRLERQRVFNILSGYLEDDSRIVKTFALQGLAELAGQDHRYAPRVLMRVESLIASGIPSVESRARKLLPQLWKMSLPSAE